MENLEENEGRWEKVRKMVLLLWMQSREGQEVIVRKATQKQNA